MPLDFATPAQVGTRPRWEVADIFRFHGPAYRHDHCLPSSHLEVMHDIETCRTAHLGGHVERCESCGFERHAYNSCRNRHCPKCQALAKAKWLEARRTELLPVHYFHAVFTVPHLLNPLALCNKRVVFDILFRAASETLLEFGSDPKHGLGGRIGFTAILHTWDQRLLDHIHLHCLIPGGALSPDRKRWVSARSNFLFPVRALSKVFRGKFLEFLGAADSDGTLRFPKKTAPFRNSQALRTFIGEVRKRSWVVYCKPSFAGPDKVLDYLGRYTHRVAIANHRIKAVKNDAVTFECRDRTDRNRLKRVTLTPPEFIRRFLLHVLPKSYMRIRHFGFLAGRSKGRDLACCRHLLGARPASLGPNEEATATAVLRLTGIDIEACPCCQHGTMRIVRELPPLYAALRAHRMTTSTPDTS